MAQRQNRKASAPVNERADVQLVSHCERTGEPLKMGKQMTADRAGALIDDADEVEVH